MKRCLALLIAISLIIAAPSPSRAASNCAYTTFHDNSIDILTPDSFEQFFISESTASSTFYSASPSSEFSCVDYSYTFTESTEEESCALVTLNIQLAINATTYSFALSGSVYPYVLKSEDILWEGMLEGSTIINNKHCVLLASFIRLNDSPDIQVSLTIHYEGHNDELAIVALSFGSDILTNEMYDELQSTSVDSTSYESEITSTLDLTNTRSTGNFDQIGNHPSYVSSGSTSILGHRQYVYFNELSSEMAVSIRTYCDNINPIYENDDNICETFVHTFEIRLKRGSYDHEFNIANIDGVNHYDFPLVNGGSVNGVIGDLFISPISLLDEAGSIPISILNSVFGLLDDAVEGTVESSDNYTNSYVKVRFGAADNHNFDELTTGLPVCFLLTKNEAGYIGNSKLIAVTSITYKTAVLNANTLQSEIIYTTSPMLTKTYTITLL